MRRECCTCSKLRTASVVSSKPKSALNNSVAATAAGRDGFGAESVASRANPQPESVRCKTRLILFFSFSFWYRKTIDFSISRDFEDKDKEEVHTMTERAVKRPRTSTTTTEPINATLINSSETPKQTNKDTNKDTTRDEDERLCVTRGATLSHAAVRARRPHVATALASSVTMETVKAASERCHGSAVRVERAPFGRGSAARVPLASLWANLVANGNANASNNEVQNSDTVATGNQFWYLSAQPLDGARDLAAEPIATLVNFFPFLFVLYPSFVFSI